MPTALLICHADSFIRAADAIADRLEVAGYETAFWLTRFGDFNPARAADHLRDLAFDRPFVAGPLIELLSARADELARADAVIAALPGSEVRRVMHAIGAQRAAFERGGRRPIVASFYNGVAYENWVEGFLSRAGADVHAMNGAHDRERCLPAAAAFGIDTDNIVVTGLPGLDRAVAVERNARATEPGPGDVVFAAQPTVPGSFDERRYLFERLFDLAEADPSRTVRFKPRLRPDQATMHDVLLFDEDVYQAVRRVRTPPANFEITHEPMDRLIARAGLVVTVSSTAAVEALAAGVPAALLGDFGLPDHYGGSYFLESGLITTLDRLLAGEVPTPDPAWLASRVVADGRNCERLVEATDTLVRAQAAANAMTPIRPGFEPRARSEVARLDPGSAARGGAIERVVGRVGRAVLRVGPVKAVAKRAYLAVRAGQV